MAKAFPPSLLGLRVSGDVGGVTYYTDRDGNNIAFPQDPPKVPRSILQAKQRIRWAATSRAWDEEPAHVRRAYTLAAARLSLQMGGRNLYFSLAFRQDEGLRQTLERQSGQTLPMPPDARTQAP